MKKKRGNPNWGKPNAARSRSTLDGVGAGPRREASFLQIWNISSLRIRLIFEPNGGFLPRFGMQFLI